MSFCLLINNTFNKMKKPAGGYILAFNLWGEFLKLVDIHNNANGR